MLSYYGEESETYTCPPDYPLFKAAQYCHCPPWELLEQSVYWQERALLFMNAEAGAQKSIQNAPQGRP